MKTASIIMLLVMFALILYGKVEFLYRCYTNWYEAGKQAAISRLIPYVGNGNAIATTFYNKGYRKGYDKWRYS